MSKTFVSTSNLLNVRTAARRLRVDPDWLAAETRSGRLPGLKAGKTYLYDWETLEAALLKRVQRRPAAEIIALCATPDGGDDGR